MEQDLRQEVRLVQGNEACAEGALAAGVGFFAGYPITPATEIAEIMSRRLPEEGGVYLQMEDEIASAAAVVGAACGGAKSIIALAPWTVQETFSLTVRAFNLSERFRVPVFLLSDAVLSHMREKVALPSRDELKIIDRRRPTGPFERYECFKPEENGVPLMADFGSGY